MMQKSGKTAQRQQHASQVSKAAQFQVSESISSQGTQL
jgi:hypothetical protein